MAIFIGDDTTAMLQGGAENDLLFSGFNTTIAHTLVGEAGDDVLIGGTSVAGDVLAPGAGNNTVLMGNFAATLLVGKLGETNTVFGFGEGDAVHIAQPTSERECHVVQDGADLLVQIGGIGGSAVDHTTVLLKGVQLADVHAGMEPDGTLTMT